MVCRVITWFIEYRIGWTDVNDKELTDIDTRYMTLEKLLEEIGDKKEISELGRRKMNVAGWVVEFSRGMCGEGGQGGREGMLEG